MTDVDGFVARVAQPECVGYRLSDGGRVNLILLHPDIRWHSLERARAVVDGLVSMPRLWGLRRETVAQLRRVSADLARIAPLRPLYGADGPAVPDRAEDVRLPASARGLQGYQINFATERYDRVRAAARAQLGPPSGPGSLSRMTPPGSRGEVLEWAGEHTVAILRQHGPLDASGYLLVLTRAYLTLLAERPGTAEAPSPPSPLPRPNPTSHAWFLEIVESFAWARETAKAGPMP